jgi:hypothetical protein
VAEHDDTLASYQDWLNHLRTLGREEMLSSPYGKPVALLDLVHMIVVQNDINARLVSAMMNIMGDDQHQAIKELRLASAGSKAIINLMRELMVAYGLAPAKDFDDDV